MSKKKKMEEPIAMDVHDGIPDRDERVSRKRLVMVLAIWTAWMGFLLYILLSAQV
jgi:hypothetical protein